MHRPLTWTYSGWPSWSASLASTSSYFHSHGSLRSEEHTSELQSPYDLVCRLLLEKKKRQTLFAEHAKRVRPGLDDKLLVAWNGLMIHALAQAAGALYEPRYLAAATTAAYIIINNL